MKLRVAEKRKRRKETRMEPQEPEWGVPVFVCRGQGRDAIPRSLERLIATWKADKLDSARMLTMRVV